MHAPKILSRVARAYEVPIDNILGGCRKRQSSDARAVAAMLLKHLLRYSYQDLNRYLRASHPSGMRLVTKGEDLCKQDKQTAAMVWKIIKRLERDANQEDTRPLCQRFPQTLLSRD